MNLKTLIPAHTTLNEETAEQLRHTHTPGYTVEVRPPIQGIPATLSAFVKGIREFQTTWFGLQNTSPVISYEIRRPTPDQLRFQYTVPTKRLERKLRTHLSNEIPGVEFTEGENGLPVHQEDSIGGGLLTAGRNDYFPLRTDYQTPPSNAVAAALHRHAMRQTRIIIQLLFQPVIGQPLRNWWWRKQAYQHRNYLNKEKEQLWGSTQPTTREKKQARLIDDKAGSPRFKLSIRLLIIGAQEYTPSRIKELAGSYNIYEDPDTGQYLNPITVRGLRQKRILSFCNAVNSREYRDWSHAFHVSENELAALLAIPSNHQDNITTAKP